jgi:hypothetical protein
MYCLFNLRAISNGQATPEQASGFQGVEASRFGEIRSVKVARLLELYTGRLYANKILPVLISVIGSDAPSTTVRLEELRQ